MTADLLTRARDHSASLRRRGLTEDAETMESLADALEAAHRRTVRPAPLPLSPAQKAVLDYLREYIPAHEYAPTLREIAERTGVRSLATVHEHLSKLEQKGYLRRSFGDPRSTVLIHD